MYKEVLRSIEGVGLYPMITLVVFVLFFTTVLLWVLRMRSGHAHHMAGLPLEDGSSPAAPETGDSRHG